MQVTTQTLENQTVALQVEIEPERVNQVFERVYRQLGRYVEVPGFRPGKAPLGWCARRCARTMCASACWNSFSERR
jgi:trigger factor